MPSLRRQAFIAPVASTLSVSVFAVLCGLQLSTPVITDEVVTIAHGSYLLGNDWSHVISATGNLYFKYLYGVIVVPFLGIFNDPQGNV